METLFLGTQGMIKATVNALSKGKLQRKNRSRACEITQLGEASCSIVPKINKQSKSETFGIKCVWFYYCVF